MSNKWTKLLGAWLMGSLLLMLSAAAQAAQPEKPDGFPDRPITIIVPFGAGGGSDQFARALAEPMSKVLGVPIQVVNKPGGGGRAGIPDFMAAPTDGYTIMQFSDDVLTQYSSGKISENPTVDWVPIGIGNVTFSQIYIKPDNDKFSDWESLVAYAKENPGEVPMANISHRGSMERVTTANLEEAAGIKFKQISYDKPSERYAALVGGHVETLFEQPGDVVNFIKAGQMKPILTILKEKPKAFADTPSLADVGIDIQPLLRVRGMVVQNGIPEERIAYLEWAFKEAWNSESFQKFLERKYMTVISSYRDSEGSVELIRALVETYNEAYEKLGIK